MDRDAAHWEAVEEAAELMHEERFHEAILSHTATTLPLRSGLDRDMQQPRPLVGVAAAVKGCPAATYSPTRSPSQYHRRYRA